MATDKNPHYHLALGLCSRLILLGTAPLVTTAAHSWASSGTLTDFSENYRPDCPLRRRCLSAAASRLRTREVDDRRDACRHDDDVRHRRLREPVTVNMVGKTASRMSLILRI